eukprot:6179102-Pleurochrysis_carterae.AAC.5
MRTPHRGSAAASAAVRAGQGRSTPERLTHATARQSARGQSSALPKGSSPSNMRNVQLAYVNGSITGGCACRMLERQPSRARCLRKSHA